MPKSQQKQNFFVFHQFDKTKKKKSDSTKRRSFVYCFVCINGIVVQSAFFSLIFFFFMIITGAHARRDVDDDDERCKPTMFSLFYFTV